MSHFSVAVITANKDNIENMLEPYNENLEVDPYISLTKEKIIEGAKKLKEKYTKELKEFGHIENFCKKYINAKTDEELYKANIDKECYKYDKNGNELSTYNPKSKWDWYQIGGRWYNTIIVKNNITDCISNEVSLLCKEEKCKFKGYKYCAGAKIKDIEFDKMIDKEKEYQNAITFWELYVEGRKPKNNTEKEMLKGFFYTKEYFLKRYKNKEDYAKSQTLFQTYALLTDQGWLSKGEMGWFGMDNSTYESEEKFIELLNEEINKKENQNKYLIIVDCHI